MDATLTMLEFSTELVAFPWSCGFGTSTDDVTLCGFTQDVLDHDDWLPWSGLTATANSGPPESTAASYGTLALLQLLASN